MTEFKPMQKVPRFSREIIITEKLDGTNASIYIGPDGEFRVGSRNRWIQPEDDNYGFAKWAYQNKEDLMKLGPGHHFGEWWGIGIQRGYDIFERRFSLFNVSRWGCGNPELPRCCSVVPTLYIGYFDSFHIHKTLCDLERIGSMAAPGYMRPEGIVIYHTAARVLFKKTFEDDAQGKGNKE